jgi:UDP-N-acetylglucosamine--N-acetylmuramyl-(pentapeptide) pyrophosphoryl-undecaprenol N-acetylglucosamine transferase
MVAAYASADLAMCRCGSSTLAELTVVGLPAILVPYPYSHRDHQRFNAEILAKKGAGILIPDSELTPALFASTVQKLQGSPGELIQMAGACAGLGRPDAAVEIADLAVKL